MTALVGCREAARALRRGAKEGLVALLDVIDKQRAKVDASNRRIAALEAAQVDGKSKTGTQNCHSIRCGRGNAMLNSHEDLPTAAEIEANLTAQLEAANKKIVALEATLKQAADASSARQAGDACAEEHAAHQAKQLSSLEQQLKGANLKAAEQTALSSQLKAQLKLANEKTAQQSKAAEDAAAAKLQAAADAAADAAAAQKAAVEDQKSKQSLESSALVSNQKKLNAANAKMSSFEAEISELKKKLSSLEAQLQAANAQVAKAANDAAKAADDAAKAAEAADQQRMAQKKVNDQSAATRLRAGAESRCP